MKLSRRNKALFIFLDNLLRGSKRQIPVDCTQIILIVFGLVGFYKIYNWDYSDIKDSVWTQGELVKDQMFFFTDYV